MKRLTLGLLTLGFALFGIAKDLIAKTEECITCSASYIPGNPSPSNLSLGVLFSLHNENLHARDRLFMSNLNLLCENFYEEMKNPKKALEDSIIPEMNEARPSGNIEKVLEAYFVEAGCSVKRIGTRDSSTYAPFTHIAAEVPTTFFPHLKSISNYLTKIGRPDIFKKAINAKNTLGLTTLDYILYMIENRKYITEFETGMNEMVKFLCANGAELATYKGATPCDGKYLSIPR